MTAGGTSFLWCVLHPQDGETTATKDDRYSLETPEECKCPFPDWTPPRKFECPSQIVRVSFANLSLSLRLLGFLGCSAGPCAAQGPAL
eukprot:scaffold6814_cov117-Isochrysis_galbana.AAC.5